MKPVDELEVLSRTAAGFTPRLALGIALPNLLFFTDPARVADPEAVARRLPAGAGVVFRAFGAPGAVDQGRRLRAIADKQGLVLLAGADAVLAEAIGADGLHLPQRLGAILPTMRVKRPDWLLTVAAHDLTAVLAASAAGADAVVVSPIFASNSPSAGPPLGVGALRDLVAATATPIYALGGIRAMTVDYLVDTGLVGLAAIEALVS